MPEDLGSFAMFGAMSSHVRERRIALVLEGVTHDAAVATCLVPEGVTYETVVATCLVYTFVVVVITVCFMRTWLRLGRHCSNMIVLVEVGTQTVRDKADILQNTCEAIKKDLRRRGMRADGYKADLAERLHEHLLHEARVA